MTTLARTYASAEARSCIAALADIAGDFDASVSYERALLYLDEITGDVGPATWELEEADAAILLTRAECAIEELASGGVDPLQAELLLDMLGRRS